jgi:DNA polymerase-3 subunit alpha
MSFTHLHLHTQYSILDSVILIPELMQHLKKINMSACAITDHGWMAGIIEFYKACKTANIKPLIGIEIYCTNDPDDQPNELKTRDNFHAVLIAKDSIGLKKIFDLLSRASFHNFYYKPRIYYKHLVELKNHAIITTACLGGIIAKVLTFTVDEHYGKAICCTDQENKINKIVEFYQSTFQEDFYLELQVWNDATNYQQVYNQYLLNLGKEKGIPFVITSDCHYIYPEEWELHELIMAMQYKTNLEDYRETNNIAPGPHFYVANSEEMKQRALSLNCEEAYYNTQLITEKCNVEFSLNENQPLMFDITKTSNYLQFLKWREKNAVA